MALDFPPGTTVGQVFGNYVWDGFKWTLSPHGIPLPSNANPKSAGVAAPGSALPYSREDHIHPLAGLDVSTQVAITGAVALTTAALGKLHLISGTASYTVTLPTPVGNAGALIGFTVDNLTNATKLYTIASPAGTVGRFASLVMWAGETILIRSNGTNWAILDARRNPMTGLLYTTTDQAFASGAVTCAFTNISEPAGLNLCFDSVNKRFLSPRTSIWTLSLYGYVTQTGGSQSNMYLVNAAAQQLGNVFSWTGSVNAGTIYGTTTQSFSGGDGASMHFMANGTSAVLANSGVAGRLEFAEAATLW